MTTITKTKNEFYRQCKLEKSKEITTSWIPEKFAKKGRIIKIRENKQSPWNNGWTITSVGTRMNRESIDILENTHTKTRGVSDI